MTLLLVWILNAVALLVVAYVLPGIVVASFWSAVGGAIVVSVTNLILNVFTRGPRGPGGGGGSPARAKKEKPADVIDI